MPLTPVAVTPSQPDNAAPPAPASPPEVLVPYPPGTRLPTQWACWLDSACTHLKGTVGVVGFSDVAPGPHAGAGGRAHPNAGPGADGFTVPLVRQGALGTLTAPGCLETGEPADLAWRDETRLHRLAEQLARQPYPVHLPRVPLGSPSIAALAEAFRGRGWLRTRPTHGSPFIELDPSWAEPVQRFNAGRQSDFRRASRRAAQGGELRFEVHAPSPGPALDQLLDDAYDVEARSWKGAGGTALAVDPQLGPFYRRLAHAAAQAGMLRLCFLRIGGRAAAMQLALQAEGRFWLMKIGYDAAFARCSPGQLLMLHTIGHAAAEQLDSFEMLGNAAPWTAGWTQTLRPFVQVQAYPASWAGARAVWADAVRAAGARWRAWTAPPGPEAVPA